MKHNWEYKPFKQLSDILYGCPFESEFFNSESKGMPLIRIRDVKPGYTSTYFNGGYSDDYIIKKGDYLIGMDGEFNIAPWQSEDALLNQRVCRVKSINENVILSNFIYYFLGKELKDIEAQTSFVTVKHLSAKVLNAINTPVPPMEVQERIVAELDKINGTIEDCRELLRNLDALAQSLFYDFFGDPITNTKGWKSQTLAELCTVTSSNRIFAEEYCDEGIPFYRGKEISELSRGEKISIELFISANRYEKLKSANNVPQINDILITAVGTIGNIWVVDTLSPFYFKDGNIIWLKDINFKVSNSKYFRYLLYRLIDIEKNKMVNGSAYKALTIQNLKKLSVFLPPLSLQEKFAERIEQIETQKKIVESTIAELQTLLDSRMDYWFN